MKEKLRWVWVVLEIFLMVVFLVRWLPLGIYRLFPQFESWQTVTIGFAFPVFVDVVMIGLACLAIWLRGRSLEEHGLTFRHPKYHLGIVATCFLPVVLGNFPFAFVDPEQWGGALVLAVVQTGLLFWLGSILRKKTDLPRAVMAGLVLIPLNAASTGLLAGKAVMIFLTYALFVGFGEEIFYRGYVQSRLNEVLGRPFRFFGISFGWGAILTAVLFGLSHTGLLGRAVGLETEIHLAHGFWTFFSGLVFGLVREKTGSILAPALLHGLPQALAEVGSLLF